MYRELISAAVAIAACLCVQATVKGDILGSAEGFAVLGGSTVTNTGNSTVTGNLGVWPGTSITGFPPGILVGEFHAGNPFAQQAKADAAIAYTMLAAMPVTTDLTGQDLGGLTLGPGVYRFSSAASMGSTPLTLDGGGNPNAQFVFQIGTTFTSATGASVVTINSASACNVYWQVGSSATLGTGTLFKGTFISQASITLTTGATITEGRAIALDGAVTMDTNSVSLNGCSLVVAGRRVAHSSADINGRTTITFISPTGRPVMLQRSPAGGWTTESLDQTAPPVSPTTNQYATHTFVDTRDGKTYVTVTSDEAVFVVDTASSPLAVRNLTAETTPTSPDTSSITGPSTVFSNGLDGTVNIIGVNALDQVVRYFQTGAVNGGQPVWDFMNITTEELTPNGIPTPEFAANLVAYPSSWGGLHVAGLNSAGEVNAVWWAPGAPNWQAHNISQAAQTPPFMVEAGLTAFVTPWGGLNLAGLDAEGHVNVQWWVPESGAGNWVTTDLTETFGGTPLDDNVGLTSFVMPWGALNVAGVTPAGDLVNYWWVPGFDDWIITSITDATGVGTPERVVGALTAIGGPDGTANIIGESANGDMVRYHWQPGDGGVWSTENVSDIAVPR